MTKIVSVPNIGDIEFPDEMENQQMESIIKNQFPSVNQSINNSASNGSTSSPWYAPIIETARNIGAGGQELKRDIENFPHNLVAPFSPTIASKLPYDPETNQQISASVGINNPSIWDEISQGVASYAPFGMAGEAAMAPNSGLLSRLSNIAKQGAAYGAVTSPNPYSGGIEGGIANVSLGAGTEGLSNALSAGKDAIKNFLIKSAAGGIADKISSIFNPITNSTNESAVNAIKNNYIYNYVYPEKNAWDNLTESARYIDNSDPNIKYDDSSYVSSLKNEADRLSSLSSRQSGYSRANDISQDLLNGYAADQHGTFSDAIEHNKSINKDFENQMTDGSSIPFNTVNFAKGKLNKSINENLNNNGLQDTLGKMWNDANNLTKAKQQTFNTIWNSSGKDTPSTFSRIIQQNSPYQDPTLIIKDYLPSSRGDGIQKMQQFSKMIGDEDAAKSVMRMNYFDNAIKSDPDKINSSALLSKYNSLSDEQKAYLFDPDQKSYIDSLNKIYNENKDAFNQQKGGMLGHGLVAGIFGLMGALHGGVEEGAGAAIAGNLTSGLLSNAAKKIMSTPGGVNFARDALLNATAQQPSIVSPLLGDISRAAVTPSLLGSSP